jgi:hypothetical protein
MDEHAPTREHYENLKKEALSRGTYAHEEKNMEVPPNSQHYKKLAIEPLTVILANNYGFLKGNALKYLMREEYKNGVDDLEKAIWYIKLIIAEREREITRVPDKIADATSAYGRLMDELAGNDLV